MCIICIQWNKNKDLGEISDLIRSAKNEPNAIPEPHLKEVIEDYIRINHLQVIETIGEKLKD